MLAPFVWLAEVAEDKGWLDVGLDTETQMVVPELEADEEEEEEEVVTVDDELVVLVLLSAKVFAYTPVFEPNVIPLGLSPPAFNAVTSCAWHATGKFCCAGF